LCGVSLALSTFAHAKDEPVSDATPKVQIALLLDTSNSMDGLIDQAKTQLWRICNTFIGSKVNGKEPILEIALYEYGNVNIDSAAHWVRQVEPLTRDLDEVSRELFALKTNGGDEYCGAVIQRSITDLQWDDSPTTYKVIFIAGNGPFNQGPIDASQSCSKAKQKQVIVNSIYCGDKHLAINERWHDGPAMADGVFLTINANEVIQQIDAPQDQEIARLNLLLNDTYIQWGQYGSAMKMRQQACDTQANDHAKSGAAIERSITKASANYCNASWDIVDAVDQKTIKLDNVDKTLLPKEMQAMTHEQRVAHVAKLKAQRKGIQDQILQLAKAREEFLRKHRETIGKKDGNTLDQAAIKAVREQAGKKGFQFQE
jgi:hypothetical protein